MSPAHVSTHELKLTLEEREQQNLLGYLDVSATLGPNLVRKNVFSKERVDGYNLRGTIRNTASQAYFKDVSVRIAFYSKTDSRIGFRDYLVYEVVAPGFNQSFTYTIEEPPAGYASFTAEVVGAIPVASSYIDSRSDH